MITSPFTEKETEAQTGQIALTRCSDHLLFTRWREGLPTLHSTRWPDTGHQPLDGRDSQRFINHM